MGHHEQMPRVVKAPVYLAYRLSRTGLFMPTEEARVISLHLRPGGDAAGRGSPRWMFARTGGQTSALAGCLSVVWRTAHRRGLWESLACVPWDSEDK